METERYFCWFRLCANGQFGLKKFTLGCHTTTITNTNDDSQQHQRRRRHPQPLFSSFFILCSLSLSPYTPHPLDYTMIRRTMPLWKGRTIVRDPRKKAVPAVIPEPVDQVQEQQQQQQPPPLPYQPTPENQQAVGSSLGSYALMGAGMAVGFSIVGALFGGF